MMHCRIIAFLVLCTTLWCHASRLPATFHPRIPPSLARRAPVKQSCMNVTANTTSISAISTCIITNPEPTYNDCINLFSDYVLLSACYTKLNISDWVMNWVSNTTCNPQEPFGSCFFRHVYPPGNSCFALQPMTLDPKMSWNCNYVPDTVIANTSIEAYYVANNLRLVAIWYEQWRAILSEAVINTPTGSTTKSTTFNTTLLALSSLGILNLTPLDPKQLNWPSGLGDTEALRLESWVLRQAIQAIPELGKILCSNSFSNTDVVKSGDIENALTSIYAASAVKIQAALNKTIGTAANFVAFPDLMSVLNPFLIPEFGLDWQTYTKNWTDYTTSSGKAKTQLESSLYSQSICASVKL